MEQTATNPKNAIWDVLSALNVETGKLYVRNIKTRLTALKTPDYLPETKMAWPSLVPDPCKRTTDEQRKKYISIPRQLDRLQHQERRRSPAG